MFQVSASRHKVRSPHMDESTEPMDLGAGREVTCSTEWMSPLASVPWRGREDHKGRQSTGAGLGWPGMFPTPV